MSRPTTGRPSVQPSATPRPRRARPGGETVGAGVVAVGDEGGRADGAARRGSGRRRRPRCRGSRRTPAAATQPRLCDRRRVAAAGRRPPSRRTRPKGDHRDDEEAGEVLGPAVAVGVAPGRRRDARGRRRSTAVRRSGRRRSCAWCRRAGRPIPTTHDDDEPERPRSTPRTRGRSTDGADAARRSTRGRRRPSRRRRASAGEAACRDLRPRPGSCRGRGRAPVLVVGWTSIRHGVTSTCAPMKVRSARRLPVVHEGLPELTMPHGRAGPPGRRDLPDAGRPHPDQAAVGVAAGRVVGDLSGRLVGASPTP